MAAMTRNQFRKQLEPGLNTIFGEEYDRHPEEYSMVFQTESSNKAFEEDVLMTGFGLAQETSEGEEYAMDSALEGWTKRYTHRKVTLSFEITQEAVEDNLYYKLGNRYAAAMARSFKQTKEIYAANVLNGATTMLGGDGVPLLSTAHPLIGGGTASNFLGAIDLSESGIEQGLTVIRNMKDDRGLPISVKAMKLVVPPGSEFNAHRITESNLRSGTDLNDTNAIKDMGFFQSAPISMTNLTDLKSWYLTTDVKDGLKHISRIKLTKPKMTIDDKTGNFCYSARERYSEGHTDWRGLVGSMVA